MPARIHIEIPSNLVNDYEAGRVTAAEVATQLGVSASAVLRELHALGVDTSIQKRKRLMFLCQAEEKLHLPPGAIPATVLELYRQGLGTRSISRRLGVNSRTVGLILIRRG